MGWGEKAIEIRSVSQGLLDGVFMHKRANKLKFLCERNDKVFFASVQSPSNSQGRCLKNSFNSCGESDQLIVFLNFAKSAKRSFASKYFKF